jgi:hypothetical protein
MNYRPSFSTAAMRREAQQARAHEETRAYYSNTLMVPAGIVDITAVGSPSTGVWTADNTFVAGTGNEYQAVLLSEMTAGAATVITFDVVYDDDAAGLAVATFNKPNHAPDQGFGFPRYIGVDLIPTTSGKTIKSITGLRATGGDALTGGAVGARIAVRRHPSSSQWIQIEDLKDKGLMLDTPGTLNVPSEYSASKYVKKARGEVSKLTLSQIYKNRTTGLPLLVGNLRSFMLVTSNDGGATVVERIVCEAQINGQPDGGETGAVTFSATGDVQNPAIFN